MRSVLRDLLSELTDAPFPFERVLDDAEDSMVLYEFDAGGEARYGVLFEKINATKENWTVGFNSRGIQAPHHAARVFSTVVACLVAFLKLKSPDLVRYTGMSSALDELYKRAQPRLHRLLKPLGYRVEHQGDFAPLFFVVRDVPKTVEVFEVADSPYPIKGPSADDETVSYGFASGDARYVVAFELVGVGKDDPSEELWDLEFWVANAGAKPESAGRVFATVFSCVEKFLKRVKPAQVDYNPLSPELGRLYRAGLGRMGARLEALGYSVTEGTEEGGTKAVFRIERSPRDLLESGDAPYRWTRSALGGARELVAYRFVAGAVAYTADFEEQDEPDSWQMRFRVDRPEERAYGPATKVFSTVLAILVDFCREDRPGEVEFYGDDSGLQDLYERALPRMEAALAPAGYGVSLRGGRFYARPLRGRLMEMADSPFPISRGASEDNREWYRFDAGAGKYIVTFDRLASGRASWVLNFELESGEKGSSVVRVFASVMACLEDFLKLQEPESVIYYAADDDLERVYERALPRVDARLRRAGYTARLQSGRAKVFYVEKL